MSLSFLIACSPNKHSLEEARKILTEAETTKKQALDIQSHTEQLKWSYEKTREETEALKTKAEMILKKAEEIKKEADEAKNNAESLKDSLMIQISSEPLDLNEKNDLMLPYPDETEKTPVKAH